MTPLLFGESIQSIRSVPCELKTKTASGILIPEAAAFLSYSKAVLTFSGNVRCRLRSGSVCHPEQAGQAAFYFRLFLQPRREKGLWISRRSWSWNYFCSRSSLWLCDRSSSRCRGRLSCAACCAAARSTTIAASRAASIYYFISAEFQSFFSLSAYASITVSQSTGQCRHDTWTAAAVVLTNLVTNFISSFRTNSFIRVIQSIDESVHNFRVAAAVVAISELVNRCTTLFRIAGCH